MKKTILLMSVVVPTIFISSCGSKETATEHETIISTEQADSSSTEKVKYTCPMDADVVSDKPGSCPKCGMDLEKK